jgi:hypothetical protein
MDAETRARAIATIDTAKPDDLIVVATVSTDGGATIHTITPRAIALVDLASSLLDQALDILRENGAEGGELALQIEDALDILPDRFADPAEEGAADA